MKITMESINNDLDVLLKYDHLIIYENIILDSNIWKNALANYIKFGGYYNKPLDNDVFPLATHITFGNYYNQPLDKDIFPLATYITFDNNQPLDKDIFSLATTIIFGDNYNQPLDKDIFPSATHIIFGFEYDQQIIKICDKINVYGKYIKKYSDIYICKNDIINDIIQYDLRYIYDIGYVFQDDYEYYRNIMKTLLLIRNNILEYNNKYSKISDLPNELIQNICKFIL